MVDPSSRRCSRGLCGARGDWAPDSNPPVALRRPCKGTMACRAGVAESSTSSMGGNTGDHGSLGLSFLRSKGAELHMPQRTEQGSLGHVPLVGASPPPYVELGLEHEESEDDPFGHQLLDIGFDDREQEIAARTIVQPETVGRNQATGSGTGNSTSAHVSHTLRRTAHVVWCSVCG